MRTRNAGVLALVVVAMAGCADGQGPVAESAIPMAKKSVAATNGLEPEQPEDESAEKLLQPFSAMREEPTDLLVPPAFEGYSVEKKGRPRIVGEGKFTVMIPIDEERSPHLKGVRDLDYIRDSLKMIAEYDSEHHYLYSRIANTGEHDIVFNEYLVGYFGAVELRWKERAIPRESDQDARRFLQGIGPHLHANITLPSRSMYESLGSNYCWLRHGPFRKSSSAPNQYTANLLTSRPRKGKGISFRDDLLDFDWAQIEDSLVKVVVRQYLANVRPTDSGDPSVERFHVDSNPITVDVEALKKYKRKLRQYREELFKEAAANIPGR
jgi:hypothetical protein